ncbi:MAG: general secretion pathway protein GspB [Pseudomonadota bacterium]
MSLILDALNRSRQDAEAVPGLATQHGSVPRAEARWRRYLPWLALLVAALIIGVLLVRVSSDSKSGSVDEVAAPVAAATQNLGQAVNSVAQQLKERAAAAQPALASAPPAAEGAVKPAPSTPSVTRPQATLIESQSPRADAARAASVTTAPAPSSVAADSAVTDLYERRDAQLASSSASDPTDDSTVDATKAEGPRSAEPAASAAAPAAEPLNEADEAEEAIDIEQMLNEAREEMANARLVEHSAPFLSGLSQQVKNEIPTVLYQRHDYSGAAGQSKVLLNGKSLGPGGTAAPGLKVEEILPDSVVLSFRGTRFRLRALNSWVNL